jgi:predicted DNA binding CopG/RHH family protein
MKDYPLKDLQLDEEEQEILNAFERGELVPVKNQEKARKDAMEAARYTLNKMKTKNINIRLTEQDLHKLKAKAMEAGLPYQTLVSSVLHRYANKDTKDWF